MVAPSRDFSSGEDTKAQVLAKTDIVQLIGQTVKLTKRGKDYVGLCPFHNERGPSFHVSPTKQFYHCFGCGVNGNAIDFVIKRDNVLFIEALRTLATAAGVEMRSGGFSKEKQGERQAMIDAHVAAVTFFQEKLKDPNLGAVGRKYLEERGFDAATIEKFRVGVAPDSWEALLKSPLMRKFTPAMLATAGLVKTRENGNGFYDTFRNRLMFPIRNDIGQTIAFGGRVWSSEEQPKYLNSPESPLFSKGKQLFGLDFAKERILATGTVAIVEGYTDVMMAHQYGVSNVVAVLGTGLTDQHVTLLRRFAKRMVLLFDADAAGDKAADRVVQLFLTKDLEIAVASMPEGMDPDEYLLAHGAEEFEKVLAGATDVLSFKWKLMVRQYMAHKDDLSGQQKAVEEYLGLLAAARGSGPVDSIRWGQALARVSRLTEIPIDELNRRFKVQRPVAKPVPAQVNSVTEPTKEDAPPVPNVPRTVISEARRRAEQWILGLLLSEPQRWHDVQVSTHVDDFLEPRHRQIAEVYWNYQRDEGELVFSTFLGLIDGQDLKELAIDLVEAIEGLKEQNKSGLGGLGPPSASAAAAKDVETAFLDQTMDDALRFITGAKLGREQQKLISAMRRSGEENATDEPDAQALQRQKDELSLFETLVKNNPSTNLHRLGPVKRAR